MSYSEGTALFKQMGKTLGVAINTKKAIQHGLIGTGSHTVRMIWRNMAQEMIPKFINSALKTNSFNPGNICEENKIMEFPPEDKYLRAIGQVEKFRQDLLKTGVLINRALPGSLSEENALNDVTSKIRELVNDIEFLFGVKAVDFDPEFEKKFEISLENNADEINEEINNNELTNYSADSDEFTEISEEENVPIVPEQLKIAEEKVPIFPGLLKTAQRIVSILSKQFKTAENIPILPEQLKTAEENIPNLPEQFKMTEENIPIVPEQLKAAEKIVPDVPGLLKMGEKVVPILSKQFKTTEDIPILPKQLKTSEKVIRIVLERVKITEKIIPIVPEQLKTREKNILNEPDQLKIAEKTASILSEQFKTDAENIPSVQEQTKTIEENIPIVQEKFKTTGEDISIVPEKLKMAEKIVPIVPEQLKMTEKIVPILPEQLKMAEKIVPILPEQLKMAEKIVPVFPEQSKTTEENITILPEQLRIAEKTASIFSEQLKTAEPFSYTKQTSIDNIPIVSGQSEKGPSTKQNENEIISFERSKSVIVYGTIEEATELQEIEKDNVLEQFDEVSKEPSISEKDNVPGQSETCLIFGDKSGESCSSFDSVAGNCSTDVEDEFDSDEQQMEIVASEDENEGRQKETTDIRHPTNETGNEFQINIPISDDDKPNAKTSEASQIGPIMAIMNNFQNKISELIPPLLDYYGPTKNIPSLELVSQMPNLDPEEIPESPPPLQPNIRETLSSEYELQPNNLNESSAKKKEPASRKFSKLEGIPVSPPPEELAAIRSHNKRIEEIRRNVKKTAPFVCTLCDKKWTKTLSSLSNLRAHIDRIHFRHVPLKCPICGETKRDKNALLHHGYYSHKELKMTNPVPEAIPPLGGKNDEIIPSGEANVNAGTSADANAIAGPSTDANVRKRHQTEPPSSPILVKRGRGRPPGKITKKRRGRPPNAVRFVCGNCNARFAGQSELSVHVNEEHSLRKQVTKPDASPGTSSSSVDTVDRLLFNIDEQPGPNFEQMEQQNSDVSAFDDMEIGPEMQIDPETPIDSEIQINPEMQIEPQMQIENEMGTSKYLLTPNTFKGQNTIVNLKRNFCAECNIGFKLYSDFLAHTITNHVQLPQYTNKDGSSRLPLTIQKVSKPAENESSDELPKTKPLETETVCAKSNDKNVCAKCDVNFPTRSSFLEHTRKHYNYLNQAIQNQSYNQGNKDNYFCESCYQYFELVTDLFAHRVKYHAQRLEPESEPELELLPEPSQLEIEIRRIEVEPPKISQELLLQESGSIFLDVKVCKICSMIFFEDIEMESHMTKRHKAGEKRQKIEIFRCRHCSAKFPTQNGLSRHLTKFHYTNVTWICGYWLCKLDFKSEEERAKHWHEIHALSM